jgi:hypothetical protein
METPIPFEQEFPEEAAILMGIYAERPKFSCWHKKLRRFVPTYFPTLDYMDLRGIN